MSKFKVGDKVKILSKSIGYQLRDTPFKSGGIGTIYTTLWDIINLKEDSRWNFHKQDLELVEEKKEEKVMYTLIKTLYLSDIITESRINREELLSLISSFYNVHLVSLRANLLAYNFQFMKYIEDKKCLIDFLLSYRYIEKLKEEIFYKIGDRFNVGGREYILATLGELKVGMVNIKDGTFIGLTTKVKDLYKIAENTIKDLTYPCTFSKIIK